MNTEHADRIAKENNIEGVDYKYYGIYEIFPEGIGCVGILQHRCSAELYMKILVDHYEHYKITDRPYITIYEMDSVIQKFMLSEFYNKTKGEIS